MDLSTFAGGYTPKFARALLREIRRDVESGYLSKLEIDSQDATVIEAPCSRPPPDSSARGSSGEPSPKEARDVVGQTSENLTEKEQSRIRWFQRLDDGDLSGPPFPVKQYLPLKGHVVDGNPRQTEEYRDQCLQAVGLGEEPDESRYGHLRADGDYQQNVELLRIAVRRGTGCFWLPGSERSAI